MKKLLILINTFIVQLMSSQYTYETMTKKFCAPYFDKEIKWKCTPINKVKTLFIVSKDENQLLVKNAEGSKIYKLRGLKYDKSNNSIYGEYAGNDGILNAITFNVTEIWLFTKKGKFIYQIESANFKNLNN